ncbi:MAG: GNAT family N-acetyltransferase [Deltaproteobacteria bacterium]|nr:GNAT family N-acetyltransferase [Deltaproteobacteria bacterium]
MCLAGRNVVLRPFEKKDSQFLEALLNGWEALDLFRVDSLLWTSEDIVQQFGDLRSFIVEERTERRPVGLARIVEHNPLQKRAEIGGYLIEQQRHQGLGWEACLLLLKYCYDYLDVARVETRVFSTNEPSLAFARTLGFREEGTLRSYLARGGRRIDLVVFALLDHEFRGSCRIQKLLAAGMLEPGQPMPMES